MNDEPRAYSVAHAAVLLGISRQLTYNLLNEGKIRCLRAGDRRLIPREALEEFLATASAQGPEREA